MILNINLNENDKDDQEILKLIYTIKDDFAKTPYTPLFTRTVKSLLKNGVKNYSGNKASLVRSIEFPPGLTLPGLNMLTYFVNRIQSKYSGKDVSVAIEQKDNVVSLYVKTDSEKILEIEHDLARYGQVLSGGLTVEDYLDKDQIETLRLENQLTVVKAQLENEKRINELQRDLYQKRIEELELSVNNLNNYIGVMLRLGSKSFSISEKHAELNLLYTKELFHKLDEVVNKTEDSEVKELLTKFTKLLETGEGIDKKEKAVKLLKKIKSKDPKVLEKLKELGYRISTSTIGELIVNLTEQAL